MLDAASATRQTARLATAGTAGAAAVAGTAMCAVLVQGYVAVPLQQLDGGLCAPEQFVHLTCVLHWRHAVC
jgi:hypothetical protein